MVPYHIVQYSILDEGVERPVIVPKLHSYRKWHQVSEPTASWAITSRYKWGQDMTWGESHARSMQCFLANREKQYFFVSNLCPFLEPGDSSMRG